MKKPKDRVLIENRKARHEYTLLDTFEAGLALLGSEVKSLRSGRGNLTEAYVRLDKRNNAWLIGAHISPYPWANLNNHEPTRKRQLLLKGHELLKLRRAATQKGQTIVPLQLVLKGHLIKLVIALAKGKNVRDKRETSKARDAARQIRDHR